MNVHWQQKLHCRLWQKNSFQLYKKEKEKDKSLFYFFTSSPPPTPKKIFFFLQMHTSDCFEMFL